MSKEYFHGLTTDDAKSERWVLRDRVIFWLVVFFVVPPLLYWGPKAFSTELSHPTRVGDLFAAAVKHGGYEAKCLARPNGCPMPAVLVADMEDDNIRGQFDPKHPTFVRINAASRTVPGTLAFNEVLVHEFVHYLQWLFGELGPQSGCRDIVRIESQAYLAGAAYLAEFGIVKDYTGHIGGIAMMAAMCEAMGG